MIVTRAFWSTTGGREVENAILSRLITALGFFLLQSPFHRQDTAPHSSHTLRKFLELPRDSWAVNLSTGRLPLNLDQKASPMIRSAMATRISLIVAAFVCSAIAPIAVETASAASRKAQRSEPPPPPPPPTLSGPARLAVVSLNRQRISLYDAYGNAVRSPISSGQAGIYDTPVGVYSVLQKKVDHTSNLYDDAKMPHMQRITWSGVALHAGALPGYPASHGCVRLPADFAERIFDMTNLGMRVVISRNDVAPVDIEHPALFQPRPLTEASATLQKIVYTQNELPLMPDVGNWAARQSEQDRLKGIAAEKNAAARQATEFADTFKAPLAEVNAKLKKLSKPLRAADSAKKSGEQQLARAEKLLASAKNEKATAQAEEAKAKALEAIEKSETKYKPVRDEAETINKELTALKTAADKAEAEKTAAVNAAKAADRKLLPASVFISLKTQRLYIRQGHEPVEDFPVTIANPETPIGTHVFTAMAYKPDGNSTQWNVVSLARYDDLKNTDDGAAYLKRRKGEANNLPVATDASVARAALDRITISDELRERLAEYVWPGSSLIVSDEPMHKKETNNFTDFIVLLDGYPQGGIKRRPPPPPPVRYFDEDGFGFFFFGGRQPPPPPPGMRYSDRYYRERGYPPPPRGGYYYQQQQLRPRVRSAPHRWSLW